MQRVSYIAFWLFLRIMALFSLSAVRRIGRALGLAAYHLAAKRARVARINIAMCMPELSPEQQEQLVKQSFIETATWICEAGPIWLWPNEKVLRHVKVKNIEHFDNAVAQGHGVILAIPHFGNWESINFVVTPRCNFACLYKHDDKAPQLSEFVRERRSSRGIAMAPADASGIRTLYKKLRAGNVVALLPDHQPSRQMGVYAPFFGNPALTGTLISTLARKNKAVVLTAIAVRTDYGFEVEFADVPDQHAEDPIVAASGLNRALEDCIRLAPAQFQWVYARFSKQPEGKPSPYQ